MRDGTVQVWREFRRRMVQISHQGLADRQTPPRLRGREVSQG